jgi:hypothetical protein
MDKKETVFFCCVIVFLAGLNVYFAQNLFESNERYFELFESYTRLYRAYMEDKEPLNQTSDYINIILNFEELTKEDLL